MRDLAGGGGMGGVIIFIFSNELSSHRQYSFGFYQVLLYFHHQNPSETCPMLNNIAISLCDLYNLIVGNLPNGDRYTHNHIIFEG